MIFLISESGSDRQWSKSPDLQLTTAGGRRRCFCTNPDSDSLDGEEVEFHSSSNVPTEGVSISAAPEQVLKVSPITKGCSQVSSTSRCCSWPGRWSCSLQERGRSCRWGRRTPRTRPVPGRPEWATLRRRRAGDYPAEWCWRLKVSGRQKHQRHAGSHSKNNARGVLK